MQIKIITNHVDYRTTATSDTSLVSLNLNEKCHVIFRFHQFLFVILFVSIINLIYWLVMENYNMMDEYYLLGRVKLANKNNILSWYFSSLHKTDRKVSFRYSAKSQCARSSVSSPSLSKFPIATDWDALLPAFAKEDN